MCSKRLPVFEEQLLCMPFLWCLSLASFPHSFQSTLHRYLANFLFQNRHFTMLYCWLIVQPIRAISEVSQAALLFLALPFLLLPPWWLSPKAIEPTLALRFLLGYQSFASPWCRNSSSEPLPLSSPGTSSTTPHSLLSISLSACRSSVWTTAPPSARPTTS